MSDNVYIISTMTNPVSYCSWEEIGGLPRIRRKVTIAGGTGLPSMKSGFGDMNDNGEGQPMWTAAGVVTPVSRDAYENHLRDHKIFKAHVEGGFIIVSDKDVVGNHKAVKKIVAGMEGHDGSAQLNKDTVKEKIARKIKVTLPSNANGDNDNEFRI